MTDNDAEPDARVAARLVIPILGALVAFGPLSIDMYLPALPAIGRDLGAPYERVQQTLGMFFIGFAVGQLVHGPLSDRLGRRPVLIGGLLLYVAASVLAALAQDVAQLLAVRLVQALGGAAGAVLARAVVRDLYQGAAAARAMSWVMMVTSIAPLAAPLAGGWMLVLFGWRAIFWVLAAFGVLVLSAVLVKLPETRPPAHHSPGILRGYVEPIARRETLGFLLAGGFAFAGMFAYIAGTPFVYIELFGVPPERYGLLFGLNIIGVMLGSALSARLVGRLGLRRMLTAGTVVIALAGIALLATTALDIGGLPGIVIPLFFYVGMMGLIGANAIAGALEEFPHRAGTVAALFGAMQFGLGALAGAAVGILHDGTAGPMGAVIAATGVAALVTRRVLVR